MEDSHALEACAEILHTGSSPVLGTYANVVGMVDTADLKSAERKLS